MTSPRRGGDPARGVGSVHLVGAGPGAPGLLTVRGHALLRQADVVLYDALASAALLASVPVPGQERIHVGKLPGRGDSEPAASSMQEAIQRLLVRRALGGAKVVRLKGGDPFVFGRGAEEVAACVAAGLPVEVVPGVTSAVAAPACAGVPVTHRDHASHVTVVTGHERDGRGDDRVRWGRLAPLLEGGTLVVLMGVRSAPRWTRALMDAGASPETPAIWVAEGTRPHQRVASATLGTLAAVAADARLGVTSPAVAVVGDVVRARALSELARPQPLAGRVIAMTRARADDQLRFAPLEALGAQLVRLPLTRQRLSEGSELDTLAADLVQVGTAAGPTDVVVTSANGVRGLGAALERAGLDTRALAGVSLWAVGPASAGALWRELGLRADHVPPRATGRGLVALAKGVGVGGRRMLFPCAAAALRTVPDGLTGLGAQVLERPCYVTEPAPGARARLETALEQGLDLVTVASPSAVDALADAAAGLGVPAASLHLAAIGPTTAEAARAQGFTLELVASPHTLDGLVSAIAERADLDRRGTTEHGAAGVAPEPFPRLDPGLSLDQGADHAD